MQLIPKSLRDFLGASEIGANIKKQANKQKKKKSSSLSKKEKSASLSVSDQTNIDVKIQFGNI